MSLPASLSRKDPFPIISALAYAIGVWTSDSLLYSWDFPGNRGLRDRAPLRWLIKREQLERGTGLFRKHGSKLLILSRFMPGSRMARYLAAGGLTRISHQLV